MIKTTIEVKSKLQIDKLLKAVQQSYEADIGILGDNVNRNDEGVQTNADIGRLHEFGSISQNVPQRSFLLAPIRKHTQEIKEAGLKALQDGIKNKKINTKQAMVNMAVRALEASTKAFFTNGFGTWKPLSPQTIAKKNGNDKPLIDTRQLLRSRSFRVNKSK